MVKFRRAALCRHIRVENPKYSDKHKHLIVTNYLYRRDLQEAGFETGI